MSGGGGNQRRRRGTPVGAGVAGASGGTGLLALVSSIPDANPWKALLTFATPSAAIAISAIWLYLKTKFDNWIADRTIRDEITKAEQALAAIEADSNSTDRLKSEARKHVEALRILQIQLHRNRIQIVVDS